MPDVRYSRGNYSPRMRTKRELLQRVANGEPCAICGKPIDLTQPQTFRDPRDGKIKKTPWSFEVDELVPVSLGGLPYGENCRPAHRICNQKRGNGMTKKTIQKQTPIDTSQNW